MVQKRGIPTLMFVGLVIAVAQSTDYKAWCQHDNSFLYTYASHTSYGNLEAAQQACLETSLCMGVTQVRELFVSHIKLLDRLQLMNGICNYRHVIMLAER